QQYLSLSVNSHGSGSAHGVGTDPSWGLLNWIVPFFHGIKGPMEAPGVRDWVGTAVAICALVGISGRTETRRRHRWFFLVLAVLVLAKVYGFGLLTWVGRLPVAERVSFATFAPPLAAFASAVLAGIGVQVLRQRDVDWRRFGAWVVTAGLVLAVVVRDAKN